MDFATVIQPSPDGILTKTIQIKDGQYKITPSAEKLFFKSAQAQVNGIESLSALLMELEKDPTKAIIRGRLAEKVDPIKHFRRKYGRSDGTGTILDASHHWVCIDFDKIDIERMLGVTWSAGIGNIIEALVGLLPSEFQGVSYHYQLSSSFGYKKESSLSAHIWFWMDIEVDDIMLRQVFQNWNNVSGTDLIDVSLYDSIQIHFTAAPVLLDGVDNKITERSGLVKHDLDEVPISQHYMLAPAEIDDSWDKNKYLKELGDKEGGKGFMIPIRAIIASQLNVIGRSGPITQQQINSLKAWIRDKIEAAPVSIKRDRAELDRYKSDEFLDPLIKGGLEKGFGSVLAPEVLREICDTYFYEEISGQFVNTKSGNAISEKAFNNKYLIHSGGKIVAPHVLQAQAFTVVERRECIPGGQAKVMEVDGVKVFNTWKPRPYKPVEGDISPLVQHIKYLCDYNDNAANHLLNWLMYAIGNPGRRIKHAIILGGEQGTGKSLLSDLLRMMVGETNYIMIDTDNLKEKYNSWIRDAEVVGIEELMAFGKREIANKLKPMITQDRISIRAMHTDAYMINNHANFFITTNHPNPIHIDPSDRRYWFYYSGATPKDIDGHPEYYEKLFGWMRDNGPAIQWAAENWALENFDPDKRPPETEMKEMLREQSRDNIEDFLYDHYHAARPPLDGELVLLSQIQEYMEQNTRIGHMPSNKLSIKMKIIGALNLGQKRLKNGTKPKVWAIRNYDKWKNADEGEIAEYFKHLGGTY